MSTPDFDLLELDLLLALETTLRDDVEDLCEPELLTRLPGRGHPSALTLFAKILHRWVTMRISPQPREVHLSSELLSSTFYQAYQSRIEELAGVLRTGDASLNDPAQRYLSKDYYKPVHRAEGTALRVKYDKLLHEWGVYHFHLGLNGGVPELLYGIVQSDAVYMVDILGHGDNFGNTALLRTAQRQWPDLFENRGLPGIRGNRLPPDKVMALRSRNVNHIVDVNNVAIGSLEPTLIDGTPVTVLHALDVLRSVCSVLQARLVDANSDERRQIAEALEVAPSDLDLRVIRAPENFAGRLLLYDQCSGHGTRVIVPPLSFPWRLARA